VSRSKKLAAAHAVAIPLIFAENIPFGQNLLIQALQTPRPKTYPRISWQNQMGVLANTPVDTTNNILKPHITTHLL